MAVPAGVVGAVEWAAAVGAHHEDFEVAGAVASEREVLPVGGLREAVDIRVPTLDAGSTDLAISRRDLAIALMRLGRYEEAEKLLLESYPVMLDRWGDDGPALATTRQAVAELGRLTGRPPALP